MASVPAHIENVLPGLSTAISAAVVAGIAYLVIARVGAPAESAARAALSFLFQETEGPIDERRL